MDVLKTRCPSCTKLYAVEPKDIKTKKPEFECSSCHVHFAFDMPDFIEDEVEVRSYLVQWQPMPSIIEETQTPVAVEAIETEVPAEEPSVIEESEYKTCPKCSFENPVKAKECFSCGVILERAQGSTDFRSSVRVREQWDRILMNYEDEGRHAAFLNYCQKDKSLPFASRKYQSILEADPTEDIALRMLEKVRAYTQVEMKIEGVSAPIIPFVSRAFVMKSIIAVLFSLVFIRSFFSIGWDRSIIAVICLMGLAYITRKIWAPYIRD